MRDEDGLKYGHQDGIVMQFWHESFGADRSGTAVLAMFSPITVLNITNRNPGMN